MKNKPVVTFEDAFEKRVNRAAKDLLKHLRANGHKLDKGDDLALLLNLLRAHFFRPEQKLHHLLSDVDFHLDEFAVGACGVPPTGNVEAVPDAVRLCVGRYMQLYAIASVHRRMLREALTAVKVDHLNKKISLPLATHALMENTLLDTKDESWKANKNLMLGRKTKK